MKKVIILFALLGSLHATAQKTGFSGTWLINKEKIDFGQAPEWILPKALKIDQQKDRMVMERTMLNEKLEEGRYSETLEFNGAESKVTTNTGSQKVSTIKWNENGQAFVVNSAFTRDGQPGSKVKEDWHLTDEGKTLVLDREAEQADGMKYTIRAFYDRQ